MAGHPVSAEAEAKLHKLAEAPSEDAVAAAEAVLAPLVLLRVELGADGLPRTSLGAAKPILVEQGWRAFLVRVSNPNGLRAELGLDHHPLRGALRPEGDLSARVSRSIDDSLYIKHGLAHPEDVAKKWLGFRFYEERPLDKRLSGLAVEYRILQLFSRDRGFKTANLQVRLEPPRTSLIYRPKTGPQVVFDCRPSRDVTLSLKDWDGVGVTASLVVRDQQGRLYPAPAQRLEPDFDFQPQVYRADGETLRLPDGRYDITLWRGPEYLRSRIQLEVQAGAPAILSARLRRWVNPAAHGWYAGDPHLHAAGCGHYEYPTMGVTPETMLRHARGEGLSIGAVLNWAPGYYYQKQFFTGQAHHPTGELGHPQYQAANNSSLRPRPTPRDSESTVRWDIEVSGFPSSHSGHLILAGLRDQEYPGAQRLEEWPSWNLPILKWARRQGAVVGFAHAGSGLEVATEELPNYEVPRFDMMGANEFVVDVAHGAVDFVSGAEFHPTTELNFWYHALNCGFSTPMIGETDFPCIYERAGSGRTYVRLSEPPLGEAGFRAWLEGVRTGRCYFGDGRSHILEFAVNGLGPGTQALQLAKPGRVTVTAQVAAWLEEAPVDPDEDHLTPVHLYWHLERARVPGTRRVPIELVVNGVPRARREITADGQVRSVEFEVDVDESAWLAVRILPSVHTAPVVVKVGGRPVRASRRSAQWSLDCIDVLWAEKQHRIRGPERDSARAAYDQARAVYRRILAECRAD
jgi:hypothetical protein